MMITVGLNVTTKIKSTQNVKHSALFKKIYIYLYIKNVISFWTRKTVIILFLRLKKRLRSQNSLQGKRAKTKPSKL